MIIFLLPPISYTMSHMSILAVSLPCPFSFSFSDDKHPLLKIVKWILHIFVVAFCFECMYFHGFWRAATANIKSKMRKKRLLKRMLGLWVKGLQLILLRINTVMISAVTPIYLSYECLISNLVGFASGPTIQ